MATSHFHPFVSADAGAAGGPVGRGCDKRPSGEMRAPAIAPATPGSDHRSAGPGSQLAQPQALPPWPSGDVVPASISPIARASIVENEILPHLDAAYNLARWLTRDRADAEEIVEDACARALECCAWLRGDQAKAWLLHFVRNAVYSRLQTRRTGAKPAPGGGVNADAAPAISRRAEPLEAAAATLPIHLLECLVLREMEQLKYREIAGITEVSIETVMSRLHRARRLLMAMTAGSPSQ